MSGSGRRDFTHLTYDDFRARAQDSSLSPNEKIGFPDSYRDGYEEAIVRNIVRLLPALGETGKTVLDLGCGCSELALRLIALAEKQAHTLLMADSGEMLAHLPASGAIRKMPGLFPENFSLFEPYRGKVDAVIVYSVLQHVILTGSLYHFIDAALELLVPGGALLLADIPNISKRDRFFSTPAGVEFHRKFTGTDTLPPVELLTLKPHKIDDGIVFGILQRYRGCGFETYLLPQPPSLPMGNRREDVLIVKG
jgi:2-polyprenyl-3-methyl-5-hydroxy-6-metoxy-1,4-benzoquinol methylase